MHATRHVHTQNSCLRAAPYRTLALKSLPSSLPLAVPPACTQWPAKRLLHLLGEMEGEYQPFVRYGSGPLLAALLEAQGVPPGPLLARRVDAHILLGLEDQHLRTQLGLDEVQVIKVGGVGGWGLRGVRGQGALCWVQDHGPRDSM